MIAVLRRTQRYALGKSSGYNAELMVLICRIMCPEDYKNAWSL